MKWTDRFYVRSLSNADTRDRLKSTLNSRRPPVLLKQEMRRLPFQTAPARSRAFFYCGRETPSTISLNPASTIGILSRGIYPAYVRYGRYRDAYRVTEDRRWRTTTTVSAGARRWHAWHGPVRECCGR